MLLDVQELNEIILALTVIVLVTQLRLVLLNVAIVSMQRIVDILSKLRVNIIQPVLYDSINKPHIHIHIHCSQKLAHSSVQVFSSN